MSQLPKNRKRNNKLYDGWSLVHLSMGILFGCLLLPWLAILLLILWEPLEIFALSPLLAKRGVEFGYETWRNSLSDIFFDITGVFVGAYIVLRLIR